MEALTVNSTMQNRPNKNIPVPIEKSEKIQTNTVSTKKPEYSDVPDTPENRKAIESAIKALEIFQPNHPTTRFQYQVHDTGTIQVALVNYLTGEVVEEVPSSKLLDYASRMEELSGLVLEEKA